MADLVMPDRDPGPGPDPLGHGEWHRKVVAMLFEYGLVACGLAKSEAGWWSEVRCVECDCCSQRGEGCWYCGLVGVAA